MATTEILLTSEAFVKGVSSISDNLAGKYLRPSIREAQEVKYRGIVGDALLTKLKTLIAGGSIAAEGNEAYKALVDRSQYFIAYSAIVEVAVKVGWKIANAGVVKTPDERMESVGEVDISKVQAYYQSKADSECLDLQNFILEHYADYPELTENDCNKIKSNLYSAATCGIWLGGPRGKRLPKV